MWNDHLINSSDHCIIFNPGDKATQRFVEEINEQVTNNILTIVVSSCEKVIRVSLIYIVNSNDDIENGNKVLNRCQMKISRSFESPSQDHLLHLILLWNWGSCLLKVLISAVKREGGFYLLFSLKLMILSNNFPLDQWIFFFSIPYHWQYQAVRWEVKLSLKISFQVGTNWSAGHYLQC